MRLARTLTFALACACTASCSPQTYFEVSYQAPFIPIAITVSSSGNVAVSVRGKIVTPVGTFGLEAGVPLSHGHQVVVEYVPRRQKTVYYLAGQFEYLELDRSDGVSVKVTEESTTLRLYENRPYALRCTLKNRAHATTPIPYPEPLYQTRYSIVGSHYFYDYRILGWTNSIWEWTWAPLDPHIQHGRYEILDWMGFVGRLVIDGAWTAIKLVVVCVVLFIELLLLPAGLVFYTGWRGLTVIAGVIYALIELVLLGVWANA